MSAPDPSNPPPPQGAAQEIEDLFDDANGDLAVGELESAALKYRRCVELDASFFEGWHALGMALMTINSPGPVSRFFTSAMATSRKPRPPAPKPESSPGEERSAVVATAPEPCPPKGKVTIA
jgi:cell division septation protein DedD